MPVKFFEKNSNFKKFAKDIGVGEDDWLFHFTGRDERLPGLKILFLDSIGYKEEKINDVDSDIWGVKLSFERESWETLYKKTGEFSTVFEIMLYDKSSGRRRDYELFRMPSMLKDKTMYEICNKNVLNENIYNIWVKVIKIEDRVNMCFRFKIC
tara:strand:+ start:455 stop:916 length:462 start_codon:yes stop_codon:yes gene_type:complete